MSREYLTDGHLKNNKKRLFGNQHLHLFLVIKIVPEELHPAEI